MHPRTRISRPLLWWAALVVSFAAFAFNWRNIVQAVFVIGNHEPLLSLFGVAVLALSLPLILVAFILPKYGALAVVGLNLLAGAALLPFAESDFGALLVGWSRYYGPNVLAGLALFFAIRPQQVSSTSSPSQGGEERGV